jgi:hypothetical protein
MKKITKIQKRLFVNGNALYYLTLLGALILSSIAAFFSVYGLSHLFIGAKLAVIFMASTLEYCKIITVSVYYRYKEYLNKRVKGFLITAVIILMIITSLGIYSFLTNAYQSIINKSENFIGDNSVVLDKMKNINGVLQIENSKLKNFQSRYKILNEINRKQQIRLDEAVKEKNYFTITKTRKEIEEANLELKEVSKQIEDSSIKISEANKEKNSLNDQIVKTKKEISKGDIGPLKFIAVLFNTRMDVIVNILVVIIIITFDPLAVVLFLTSNIIYVNRKNGNGKPKRKYKKRRKRRKKINKDDIINE